MARQATRLIACVLLAALSWAAGAQAAPERSRSAQAAQTPWSALGPEERRILGPVSDSWESMPGSQQQRLISSARRYPSLQPIQKERFDTRIREWATMAPEQRRAARETFQGLRKLPPERQHELRERWLQRQGGEESSEPRFDREPRGYQRQQRPSRPPVEAPPQGR